MDKAKIQTVSDLLNQNQAQLAALLPKVVTPARFMALCVNVVQHDTKLHDCTATSLVRCMFQAAQMGLTPGLRRQVYLVPYNNKKLKVREAQLQIGYQGLLTLARRSGQISKIDAGYVMEGDVFEFANGFDVMLRHVQSSEHWRDAWCDAWEGEGDHRHLSQTKAWEHVTYVYAYAKLTNGERHLKPMTKEEIEWHRDRYSPAAHDGPWVENIIEMGEKTALRELCNLLPSDEEDNLLGKAVALDRQLEEGQPQTIEVSGIVLPDEQEESSSNGSTGGNGSASKPADAGKPQAMRLPNFGHAHAKEKPVDHPDVTMNDLEFYLGVKEGDLGKPGREEFHNYDVKLVAAIKAEMERRRGLGAAATGSASTKATVQSEEPKPKKAEPKAAEPVKTNGGDKAAPDLPPLPFEEWQAFVDRSSIGPDADTWKQTKKAFKVKTAGEVEEGQRRAFIARFHEIKDQATAAA